MIMLEQQSKHSCSYRRSARTALLAVLASAVLLSPIPGLIAPAAAAPNDVVSGAVVDWRDTPRYGGYPAATAVSSPASATQSKGVVLIDTVLPYQMRAVLVPGWC